jgi:hypothetical protein
VEILCFSKLHRIKTSTVQTKTASTDFGLKEIYAGSEKGRIRDQWVQVDGIFDLHQINGEPVEAPIVPYLF